MAPGAQSYLASSVPEYAPAYPKNPISNCYIKRDLDKGIKLCIMTVMGQKNFIHSVWSMIPAWSGLRSLGNNRLTKTSYIWFITIPIIAKFVKNFPKEYPISELILSLRLPYSWHILFFASVCFAIASILYSWKCPSLIREYADWDEYSAKAGSPDVAVRTLEKNIKRGIGFYLSHRNKLVDKTMLDGLYRNYCMKSNVSDKDKEIKLKYQDDSILNIKLMNLERARNFHVMTSDEPGFFWEVYSKIDYSSAFTRELISIMFLTGFALLGYLFIANIWYVAELFFIDISSAKSG